jgi:hypothetical protein
MNSSGHFGITPGLKKSQHEPENTLLLPSSPGDAINASAEGRWH